MIIQIKAIEQFFHVVLFIMLYKVILTFKSVDETLVCDHSLQIKAIEQYFHVVLFIMLYKVVLNFKSMDETLMCDHSNENYGAVLSCGTVYYAVKCYADFKACG